MLGLSLCGALVTLRSGSFFMSEAAVFLMAAVANVLEGNMDFHCFVSG
jgi:hypothetical protein